MRSRDRTETGRDRAALARGAGFGRFSFISVLAGVLVAYGGLAVLLAAAYGVAQATGLNDFSLDDLAKLSLTGAAVIVVATLLAYVFGGYVAGRMARRAGLLNGLAVFVLAVLLVAALGALLAIRDGSDQVAASLRDAGIPTNFDSWSQVSSLAGLGSLLAMLVGAALGGKAGERWHSKLTRRAAMALSEREPTAPEALPAEEPPARFRTERARDAVAARSVSGGTAAPAARGGVATAERPGDEGAGGRHLRGTPGGEDVTVERPRPGDREGR